MRRYLAAVAGAVCLLSAFLMLEFPVGGASPAGSSPFSYQAQDKIPLNSASPAELALLPGVGPVKAEAIAAWRKQNGPFASIDQLEQVDGFSQRTVQALEQYVTLE